MTVEALKILSLHIQAFRGFRDEINFDFSRPVTVVYAANGTGKTSLCQAIEWIVTGTVVGVSDDDLRCKQAVETTDVRGTVAVGSKTLPEIDHTLTHWTLGTEARQNKILEALAPQVLEDRSLHHNLIIARRREWLRGTHFLFTDSLAVLVDANDDTRAARRRIFADILGVRHLEEAVEDVDRYSNRVRTAYNEALRGQKSLTDEAGALEKQLAERRRDGADESASTVTNLLVAVYSVLGEREGRPRANEIERVQSAEARIAAHESLIASRIERCSNIAVHLPQIAQLGSQIQNDRARLSHLSTANASIDSHVLDAQQNLAKINASREQVRKDRSDASQKLGQFLQQYQTRTDAIQTETTLQVLRAEFRAELALPAQSRNQKRQQLTSLRVQLPELKPVYENIRLLCSERAQITPPDPEKLRIDRAELRRLQAERRTLQGQYDSLAEPLRQLQEAAAQFAEHLAEGHTCPVCAHDWKTPAALRTALAAAGKAAPVAISAIEQRLKANAEASRKLQDTTRTATAIQTNLNRIQEQLDPLEARVRNFEAALEGAAGPLEGTAPAMRIDAALSRLMSAAWIATFQQIVEDIAKRYSIQLDLKVSISKAFGRVEAALTKYIDECAKREADFDIQFDSSSKAIGQQRQTHAANVLERQAIESRLQVNVDLTNRFNEDWGQLAGPNLPVSNEAFERLRKETFERKRQLENSRAQCAAARSLAETNALRRRRSELQTAVDAAMRRCGQISDLIEKSSALREKIDAHSRTLAWEKLSTLMPIAQALFARMHANRVFDKIHAESEESPLEWLADAGDITVNPQGVFSHGQRQDLALSLFLAKACLQGGTFVLDEPVAHLDDLNRVAVLDLFRVLALTLGSRLNIVITTSSRNLMRHLREKFALVHHEQDAEALLRIYQLEGNPRVGVTQSILSS